MRELQAEIIRELNVKSTIEPASEVEARVSFLVDYARASHAHGFVLGVSGGQDSSLAGKLCQLAVERMLASGLDAQFVAVRLPYAVQADEADARLALEFIGPQHTVVFNVQRGVDGVADEYGDALSEPILDFTKGNVKARMRMVAQYAIAGQRGQAVLQARGVQVAVAAGGAGKGHGRFLDEWRCRLDTGRSGASPHAAGDGNAKGPLAAGLLSSLQFGAQERTRTSTGRPAST